MTHPDSPLTPNGDLPCADTPAPPIATAGHGGDKRRKWVRWTARQKATFLDHLAATCNVRSAAATVGVDPVSVYWLRRKDPAFCTAWQEALEQGYIMLETQLVGHALAGGGRMITNGATELTGPIDTDLALRLLSAHGTRSSGRPRRGGPPVQRASESETDAAIMKKLRAIERRELRP